MPGRKRRASTSSVETVDDNQIRWRQEVSVVRSVDKDTPSDDWPVFELRNAVVLNKDGQTLENALEVGTRGPYIVRGQLIIEDPSQRSHMIVRVRSPVHIEIRACISYAIGESNEDRPRPLIWVSGRGGWYEIEPAPEYRSIYDKMCEATTLYYNMMDIYSSPGPKRSKKSKSGWIEELSPIFLQYATRIGDGSTFEEVVQRCSDHAAFFLFQFLQENTDVFDWKQTFFYKWLTSKHTDLFKKAQEMIKNPPDFSKIPPRQSNSPAVNLPSRGRESRSTSIPQRYETKDEAEANVVATRRQNTASRSTVISISSSESPKETTPPVTQSANQPIVEPVRPTDVTNDGDSPFSTVLNAFEVVYEQLHGSKHGMTVTGTLNKIYFAYSFPNFRNGVSGCHRIPVEEVYHYNAKALLQHLDRSKYEGFEIYSWLQEKASTKFTPFAMKPSDFPFRLVPRGSRQPKKPAAEPTVTGGEAISPIPQEEVPEESIRTPRVGKRVPGQRSGTKSSLRLARVPRKRVLEIDSDTEEPEPKKSHYFSDGDDAMQDAAEVSSDEAESATSDHPDEELVKIMIHAEKIPSTIPRGPDGTWTCDQSDCDYIVRGGDEKECQDRIQEHFRDHEKTARVSLAMSESRGLLPINHLLDKIKTIGEKTQPNGDTSATGPPLPNHIKRKLFV